MADKTGFQFQLLNQDGTVSINNLFLANTVASSNGVGALFSCGYNSQGQLGDTTVVEKSSPISIGTLTNWKQISCGYHTTAIKTDGTLWAWGKNNRGNLGDGTIVDKSSPIQIGANTNWSQVSSGVVVTAAVKTDGTLWTWGYNANGELGNGTGVYYSSPIQIGSLTNWSQVSCGYRFMSSIKTDGTLWGWGYNNYGNLGNGNRINYSSPVQVGALTTWSKVSSGSTHMASIKTDGTLWTWGQNSYGNLGNGTTLNYSSPIQIGSLTNWNQVATGYYTTSAIKTDGTLWTWGLNSTGELGNGTTINYSSPIQIGLLTNWKQINNKQIGMMALKTDGTIWTWGTNNYSQLGNSATGINYSSPVQIGSLTNWSNIPTASSHGYTFLAIANYYNISQIYSVDLADVMVPKEMFRLTNLWSSGYNQYGELGNNTTTESYSSPVQIGSLNNWKQASGGQVHAGAITISGELYMWGRNSVGQLGNGNTTNLAVPTKIGSRDDWKQLSVGNTVTFALKRNYTLWGWGENGFGSLGNGNTIKYSSPIQVGSLTNWSKISCEGISVAAIKTDGTLWTWGRNQYGQLGNGTTTNYSSPIQIGTGTNWKDVATGGDDTIVAAIKTDGTLWTWGQNDVGQLGVLVPTFSADSYSSPVQVTGGATWANTDPDIQILTVGLGDNVFLIDYNNNLWAWGGNAYGQLGNGTTTDYSSPIQIGTTANWKQVSLGYHTAAIKTDGTLWSWGVNSSGNLGNGRTINYSSPIQIGALTNWKQVACGGALSYPFSAAIKTDGTLWTWGNNLNGQLGNNVTGTSYSSPVQVGALTTWSQVSCGDNRQTAIIKTDGTLWMCGYNLYGALGLNISTKTVSYNSPVQVGALTNWKLVSVGSYHVAAIKTDGTLWTWGGNGDGISIYGQLGNGTAVSYYSSPIQIGALTNWKQVIAGTWSTAAIKTDGTLWTWGRGDSGQLGNGNTIKYSSPIQVGALTNWRQVFNVSGSGAMGAYKSDGTVWTFGYGPLGNITSYLGNVSSPIQVGANTNWKQVSIGYYSGVNAIKTDGTLWAWGQYQTMGIPGASGGINYSSPVQIGLLTNWKQVDVFWNNAMAVKTDGTLWGWSGSNNFGPLGNGTTIAYNSPIQVGSGYYWNSVSGGGNFSLRIGDIT